jgi:hypothetical protein
MKESAGHNQEAPLSYYGARRIVWLIFLLVIAGSFCARFNLGLALRRF